MSSELHLPLVKIVVNVQWRAAGVLAEGAQFPTKIPRAGKDRARKLVAETIELDAPG